MTAAGRFLYLTTTGRRSGLSEIEIWFTAPPPPALARTIRRLSEGKYGWGDGLVVEISRVE